MRDFLPVEITEIVNAFKKNGYEIFLVGGCVRDMLLKKSVKDWDLTTNATHEDLERRDFTINAIAYDSEKNEFIDPYEGQKDLEKKIIRAVGEPDKRFKEDALRLLRAIRFATQLSFIIEESTWKAILQDSML